MDGRSSIDGYCDEIAIYGYHGKVPIDGFLRVDVPNDGYQNNMDTSTDVCSSLYVGDININIEDIVASTHSFEHSDLEAEGKDQGLTSNSALEIHEVDYVYDEEEFHSHEPSWLVGLL